MSRLKLFLIVLLFVHSTSSPVRNRRKFDYSNLESFVSMGQDLLHQMCTHPLSIDECYCRIKSFGTGNEGNTNTACSPAKKKARNEDEEENQINLPPDQNSKDSEDSESAAANTGKLMIY